MIAVLGGLGAALAWAAGNLCATRAARMIGAPSTLAWTMVTGLIITVPWAAHGGTPDIDGKTCASFLVAGLGNSIGLLFVYSGYRIGKVGVVAPIASTEGAIAAVIAVAAGEALAPGTGIVLILIVTGIVMAGLGYGSAEAGPGSHARRAALFGVVAALSFGASLYATGRLGGELPVAWAVLPPRVVGVLVVALPLAISARLKLTRQALPLVVAAGVAEVVGFASFAIGARHGIAVSAVLASEFGAVAAVAAYFVFRERLTRIQVAGVVAIAVGVAAVSALQA